MAKRKDEYVNIIGQRVTEAVAGTLVFDEINIGSSVFDRIGLLLQRIEYQPTDATINAMNALGDGFTLGITSSNSISALSVDQQSVVDVAKYNEHWFSGVGSQALEFPVAHDLSTLAGGGLLVPPKPLYFALQGSGLGVVADVFCRIYFTFIELTDADYFELLETRKYYG